MGQSGEDRRNEDRHQKIPDDERKGSGNRDHQREKKSLPKSCVFAHACRCPVYQRIMQEQTTPMWPTMSRRVAFVAIMTLSSLGATAQRVTDRGLFDAWANVTEPLSGPSTPIGFYSAGCLQGA